MQRPPKGKGAKTRGPGEGQEKLTKYFKVERGGGEQPKTGAKETASGGEAKAKTDSASIMDFFQRSAWKEKAKAGERGAERREKGKAEGAQDGVQAEAEGGEGPTKEKKTEGNEKERGGGPAGEAERAEARGRAKAEQGKAEPPKVEKKIAVSKNVGLREILETLELGGAEPKAEAPKLNLKAEVRKVKTKEGPESEGLGKRADFKRGRREAGERSGAREKGTKKVKASAAEVKSQIRIKRGKAREKKQKSGEKSKKAEAKTPRKTVRPRIKKKKRVPQAKPAPVAGKRQRPPKIVNLVQDEARVASGKADTLKKREKESRAEAAEVVEKVCVPVINEGPRTSNQPGGNKSPAGTKQTKKELGGTPVRSAGAGPKSESPPEAEARSGQQPAKESKSKKKRKSKSKPKPLLKVDPAKEKERVLLKKVYFTFERLNDAAQNNGIRRAALLEALEKDQWGESREIFETKLRRLSDLNKIFITDDNGMIYKI